LIPWKSLRPAICFTFISAVLGVFALTRIDSTVLKRIVPGLLLGVAVYTALNPGLGTKPRAAVFGTGAFALIFGSSLGFYDGFFGPGAGSFWMMACVLGLGLDLRHATGTTKALNLTSNIASLGAFGIAGLLRWDAGLAMIAGQLVGAKIGSGLVIRDGARIIRPMFIATALALAARLVWQTFAPAPEQIPLPAKVSVAAPAGRL
jgi:uncharacterized protein